MKHSFLLPSQSLPLPIPLSLCLSASTIHNANENCHNSIWNRNDIVAASFTIRVQLVQNIWFFLCRFVKAKHKTSCNQCHNTFISCILNRLGFLWTSIRNVLAQWRLLIAYTKQTVNHSIQAPDRFTFHQMRSIKGFDFQ